GLHSNNKERLEKLYEQVAWSLLSSIQPHTTHDAFKFTNEQETVSSSIPNSVSLAAIDILICTIAQQLTPQPIELTCYTSASIDAIKKTLRAGAQSNKMVLIKAKLVAPPL
ncbi:hypothetical protein F4604DRAFT_1595534, partial [Suillus subluteus]